MFIKKIQFGIPITIIRGGIKAVRTVISYPSHPKIPKAHITPTATTIKEIKVALNDLKNRKKMKEVINVAPRINKPISSTIFCAFKVLIYGIPETRISILDFFSKASIIGMNSL